MLRAGELAGRFAPVSGTPGRLCHAFSDYSRCRYMPSDERKQCYWRLKRIRTDPYVRWCGSTYADFQRREPSLEKLVRYRPRTPVRAAIQAILDHPCRANLGASSSASAIRPRAGDWIGFASLQLCPPRPEVLECLLQTPQTEEFSLLKCPVCFIEFWKSAQPEEFSVSRRGRYTGP
jgi:hypothetical protein